MRHEMERRKNERSALIQAEAWNSRAEERKALIRNALLIIPSIESEGTAVYKMVKFCFDEILPGLNPAGLDRGTRLLRAFSDGCCSGVESLKRLNQIMLEYQK